MAGVGGGLHGAAARGVDGRGIHSFTFQLNVSAFCDVGGCVEGLSRGCLAVEGGVMVCLGCVCVSHTA